MSKGTIISIVTGYGNLDSIYAYNIYCDGQVRSMGEMQANISVKQADWLTNAKINRDTWQLEFTNGSIDRYPLIAQEKGGQVVNPKLVIVEKLIVKQAGSSDTEVYYKLSDAVGNTLICSADEAVAYGENIGIANGKVVSKGDSKFISSIAGEYETIEVMKSDLAVALNPAVDVSNPLGQDVNLEKARRHSNPEYDYSTIEVNSFTSPLIFPKATHSFNANFIKQLDSLGFSSCTVVDALVDPNNPAGLRIPAVELALKSNGKNYVAQCMFLMATHSDSYRMNVLNQVHYFEADGKRYTRTEIYNKDIEAEANKQLDEYYNKAFNMELKSVVSEDKAMQAFEKVKQVIIGRTILFAGDCGTKLAANWNKSALRLDMQDPNKGSTTRIIGKLLGVFNR